MTCEPWAGHLVGVVPPLFPISYNIRTILCLINLYRGVICTEETSICSQSDNNDNIHLTSLAAKYNLKTIKIITHHITHMEDIAESGWRGCRQHNELTRYIRGDHNNFLRFLAKMGPWLMRAEPTPPRSAVIEYSLNNRKHLYNIYFKSIWPILTIRQIYKVMMLHEEYV